MSDRDRWQLVKQVFDAALVRNPDERHAFVDEACGEDRALRDEVQSLLAAHADAGHFAETPAMAALAAIDGGVDGTGAPPPDRRFAVGTEFGDYALVEPIGAGAMGEVYRARDTRLGRDVAIKVLPSLLSGHPSRIARLEREARLLGSLNHPHIAIVHRLEPISGGCALVMELVEGPTLAGLLASKPLAVRRALEMAREIADALGAAHGKGIIHRDLKPANITLTADGVVKVLDFGLAEAMSPLEGDTTDAAGRERRVAGTPAYMSPEQARGEPVDQRTDIWAFGCVLFELLTGQRAFTGRPAFSEAAVSDPPVEGKAPDWHQLPASTPVGIRRLLRRCLEPDAKRRLHHIADARLEINDALSGNDDVSVAAPPGPRVSTLAVAAMAGAALVAIAIAAVLLRRPLPAAPELRVVDIATSWTSDPGSFALSPDGRRLAFVGDYQGQPTLWVRSLDAAEARPLPGTQGARRPFWSPDSQTIGFFAFTEMKRIDARGGTAQTITSISGGAAAAWGPDGTILFSGIMPRTLSPAPAGLLRVNASGGAVSLATPAPAESTGFRSPQFLPDGRHFLMFAPGGDDVRGIYLGSLDGQAGRRLIESDAQGAFLAPQWLLFVRKDALLAVAFDLDRLEVRGEPFTVADSIAANAVSGSAAISTATGGVFAYRSGRGSSTRLTWFDRVGRTLGTLGSAQDAAWSNLAVSPNGTRVIAERTASRETAFWLLDSAHQVLFAREPGDTLVRYPVWGGDNTRVALATLRRSSVDLSVRSSSGSLEDRLWLSAPRGSILSDWSRDGEYLLGFGASPSTGTDIWVVPRTTPAQQPFLVTAANEMWGQFSPDGHWIAYQSNESGRFEIYVRPFPGPGAAIPISTTGGVYVRWARDGHELYYLAPDATLMAVATRLDKGQFVAGTPVSLFRTRRVGGGVNVIGDGHQYDVSPDGRFLINEESESGQPPITLVMNWRKPAS